MNTLNDFIEQKVGESEAHLSWKSFTGHDWFRSALRECAEKTVEACFYGKYHLPKDERPSDILDVIEGQDIRARAWLGTEEKESYE